MQNLKNNEIMNYQQSNVYDYDSEAISVSFMILLSESTPVLFPQISDSDQLLTLSVVT